VWTVVLRTPGRASSGADDRRHLDEVRAGADDMEHVHVLNLSTSAGER
jgi:hypothetical protein